MVKNNGNFVGSIIFGIDENIEANAIRIFSIREGCIGKKQLLEALPRMFENIKNFIENKIEN